MKIVTLLVGVAVLGAAAADDRSEPAIPDDQPIAELGNAGKRQEETPEVVLQLKYDQGELNRIYLAQFRKPRQAWTPSVAGRSNLCADLCHAGLGGGAAAACGPACAQLIPVGLRSALDASLPGDNSTRPGDVSNPTGDNASRARDHDPVYGEPRVAVCPALCQNNMGAPLCACAESSSLAPVDWAAVCAAFCHELYELPGCPACVGPAAAPAPVSSRLAPRALGSLAGWAAWCDVQCRQGHGGAACCCDRTPFN